ncbi:hypothetical protein [Eubacterium oxidoreducens]|uniref:Uncharacterized protein n=1 Tax=Eubacterium oxidoreducens TaxID=1732 RepID=A0A1G6AYL8_EUBOX|nr:hypothetical protein [Eubacterium oxidoreducens]SDB13369.1 hypothetical protein SAMN02910417_01024 [Eubacterium oxidoreducens]
MEQFEIEKLNKAIIYADRIANGKNPINNLPVEDDYVLNDPNVIRCMFFIKDVLCAVKDNEGIVANKASKRRVPKSKFPIERLQDFKPRGQVTITPFVNSLNEGLDKETVELIKVRTVTDWLKENGYLSKEYNQKIGKEITVSTEKGNMAGITSSFQVSPSGTEYCRVEYSPEAQEVIVQNIEKIIGS